MPTMVSTFLYDLRLAVRGLLKARAFTATALVILMLGIGSTTAIATLAYHVLLSPLPYPNPDRLVMAFEVQRANPAGPSVVSPGNAADWREQSKTIRSLALFNLTSLTLDVDDGRERVPGAVVTANYFDVLGVPPQAGRTFQPADEAAGAPRAAVISHGFWLRRFAGDAAIVGRSLRAGTTDVLVVGVMPPGFRGPDEHYFGRADFWLPMRGSLREGGRGGRYLRTVARLAEGVTVEQAATEIRAIADRSSIDHADTNREWSATVLRLQDAIVSGVRPAILVVLAAVVLVHMTVCLNLANLLLSRGLGRQREYAVRAAVGASRWRIVQAVAAESVSLAAAGGVAGIVLAGWMLRMAVLAIPDLPRMEAVQLNGMAIVFALMLAVATAVIFGAMPAIWAASIRPGCAIQSSARGATSAGRRRIGRALVIAEVAVSVTLLVGAGLLGRSFARLAAMPAGFSADNVLSARIGLPPAAGGQADANRQAAIALASRIRALPGMADAGFSTSLPLFGLNNVRLGVETRTRREGPVRRPMRYRAVTPGYLRALQIERLSGRLLDGTDSATAPGAVLLNDVAARIYEGDDPIGAPIRLDFGGQAFEGVVVGTVRGIRHDSLAAEPEPEIYVPHAQHPVLNPLFLAARATGPLPTAGALREAVRAASPRATIDEVQPLRQLVDRSIAPQRLNAMLLGALSSIALVLATVSLYAIVAHGVAQRVREIGIRLALGARSEQVLALVLREGLLLAATGVLIGGLLAYQASRTIRGLLFGIDAHDPSTYLAVAAIFVVIAAAASYLPARQASRVDPIVSLRVE